MQKKYLLAIDQSTSGTKSLLFNREGTLVARADLPHRQIVDEQGFVEHDAAEIWRNTVAVVQTLLQNTGATASELAAIGISNQRETGMLWTRDGTPVENAVVWQCSRGAAICTQIEADGCAIEVEQRSGLRLSPYFTAAKWSYQLRHSQKVQEALQAGNLLAGTADSWLLYRMTGEHVTDYGNASRTQLLNLDHLQWDDRLCELFGVPKEILPSLSDSNSCFGETTLDGVLDVSVPVYSVLGDSHAAMFAQGCTQPGSGKATYGTGCSVMLHAGEKPVRCPSLAASLAWRQNGVCEYVLEGNINYAGAVFTWLCQDLELISSAKEAAALALSVPDTGGVYLVPAFTGLGAPHWQSDAAAMICGMTRLTKKAHLVRAAEESIAYQVADIVHAAESAGIRLSELRTDGGATQDEFLMQFQSDILGKSVSASMTEELSGAGAAYMAGLACGFYTPEVISSARKARVYRPLMATDQAGRLLSGWAAAIRRDLA